MAHDKYNNLLDIELPKVSEQLTNQVIDKLEEEYQNKLKILISEHREYTMFVVGVWENTPPEIRNEFLDEHFPLNKDWLKEMIKDLDLGKSDKNLES